MPLKMLLPTARIDKLLIAQAARIWLLPCMDPRVHDHILLQRKPLAAERTLVRFLPCMSLHVCLHMRRLREAPRADRARVRLLPRVHALVINQRRSLREAPSAAVAHVRLLSSVRPQVQLECHLRLETLPTVVAKVALFAVHGGAVVFQVGVGFESLGAMPAGVGGWFLLDRGICGVNRGDVALEVVLEFVAATALVAHE